MSIIPTITNLMELKFSQLLIQGSQFVLGQIFRADYHNYPTWVSIKLKKSCYVIKSNRYFWVVKSFTLALAMVGKITQIMLTNNIPEVVWLFAININKFLYFLRGALKKVSSILFIVFNSFIITLLSFNTFGWP